MTREEMIKTYQCPGCIGCDKFEDQGDAGSGCMNHHAGTMVSSIGKILLGMPAGFNRLGQISSMPLNLFLSYQDMQDQEMLVNNYNIPVWKHLDKHGNTLLRGFRPRVNDAFLFVIGGDCMDKFDCLEISQADIEAMD